MISVGDKVVALLEDVDNVLVMVQHMTVIAVNGTNITLRDVEGTLVNVDRRNVFSSIPEAQAALRVEEGLTFVEDDLGMARTTENPHNTKHQAWAKKAQERTKKKAERKRKKR